jgi:hypothetical protein
LCGETASISLYWVRLPFDAAPKRTLAMGMFEPLIKHSGDEPRLPRESPEPRLRGDVVAPILFVLLAVALLAVVLLVWGG